MITITIKKYEVTTKLKVGNFNTELPIEIIVTRNKGIDVAWLMSLPILNVIAELHNKNGKIIGHGAKAHGKEIREVLSSLQLYERQLDLSIKTLDKLDKLNTEKHNPTQGRTLLLIDWKRQEAKD